MPEQPNTARPTWRPVDEAYSLQDHPPFEDFMAARTASREAAFFLPHLMPDMRVLDAGCGPGTITLGLAEAVPNGEVVGVDVQAMQIERARRFAAERGMGNVRFETGDVYTLPFPDRSVDAVFSHGVINHLREPVRALAEMRRVLTPGGVIGLRDAHLGAGFRSPATPLMERWRDLLARVRQHHGIPSFPGPRYRSLLREAGFAKSEASASVEFAGSLEATRRAAALQKTMLQGVARTALEQGWVDQTTIDAMAAELEAWGEHPDAFSAGIWCQAIGWTEA